MFNFQAKVIKAANRRGAGRKCDCHRKCVILLPLIVFFRFKTLYWNLAYKLLFVNSTFFKFLEYLKLRPDLKLFFNWLTFHFVSTKVFCQKLTTSTYLEKLGRYSWSLFLSLSQIIKYVFYGLNYYNLFCHFRKCPLIVIHVYVT